MNCLEAPIDIRGKKILIMGLGTKDGGVGAALWAAKQGANITITDLNNDQFLALSLEELKGISARYVLGAHDEKDFVSHDIIIKNPGIKRTNKYLQLAEKHGKIIDSAEGIFTEVVAKPYIGVTGTKGKSFTTHLVEHVLNSMNIKAKAAGNNCVSPLRFVNGEQPLFVLELSSWQLREMGIHKKSPHIACWLNFFPDHLNYYRNMEEYWADKYFITQFQKENDFLIVPFSNENLRECPTKAKKVYFSLGSDGNQACMACYIRDNTIIMKQENEYIDILKCSELHGVYYPRHHLELLLATVASFCSYIGFSRLSPYLPTVKNALLTFKGLSHRFEHIKNQLGITIINDSAATTPDSVMRAIDSVVNKPLVLMYGGGGLKNLPVSALAENISKHVALLIIFDGDEPSEELCKILDHDPSIKEKPDSTFAKDMADGVRKGIDFLRKHGHGTFLFSPGCKGYPVYQDLFVRGARFRQCVEECLKSG